MPEELRQEIFQWWKRLSTKAPLTSAETTELMEALVEKFNATATPTSMRKVRSALGSQRLQAKSVQELSRLMQTHAASVRERVADGDGAYFKTFVVAVPLLWAAWLSLKGPRYAMWPLILGTVVFAVWEAMRQLVIAQGSARHEASEFEDGWISQHQAKIRVYVTWATVVPLAVAFLLLGVALVNAPPGTIPSMPSMPTWDSIGK